MAGVPETTLRRWLMKGRAASEGTRFREFYEDVQEAEAAPRVRALSILYRDLADNPMLAWKFLERREPGFRTATPGAPGRARGTGAAEDGDRRAV